MMTILCVISNLILKAGLESWLESYPVTYVATDEEALEALQRQNFHVVICHGKDFAELAERISREQLRTRVILFTEASSLIVVPMTIGKEEFKALLERVH